MNRIKKSTVAMVSGVSALVLLAGASFAIEPIDNPKPTGSLNFIGNVTMYECGVSPGCGFGTGDRISTSTDVDHIVVTCGNSKVTAVGITIQAAPFNGAGDLDIDVLRPNDPLIGASHGAGQTESVNTSAANLNTVVLRVFGFQGATNTYQVNVSCQ